MVKKNSTKTKVQPYEIGELDHYLFGQGNHYEIYKKMGAHEVTKNGKRGVYFAVWAPHAVNVSVVGEFNDWDETKDKMKRGEPLGIYTCFVPEAKKGDLYKFCIETQAGEKIYKADPFANYAELRPGTASRITDISNLNWSDSKWMTAREKWDNKEEPVSIYEVHMGSWMRHPGREDEGFYTYREFAEAITKYVKEMGYTHVELMGIAEHPFDGSWGYQVTGYYAPTARYGTPEDFAPCHLPLHRGDYGTVGEIRSLPADQPQELVLLHPRTFHRVLDGERQRLRRQRTHGADVRRNLPKGEGVDGIPVDHGAHWIDAAAEGGTSHGSDLVHLRLTEGCVGKDSAQGGVGAGGLGFLLLIEGLGGAGVGGAVGGAHTGELLSGLVVEDVAEGVDHRHGAHLQAVDLQGGIADAGFLPLPDAADLAHRCAGASTYDAGTRVVPLGVHTGGVTHGGVGAGGAVA